MKMDKTTLGEAVEQLNEKCAHPAGFHLALLEMRLFPEELENSETVHDLIKQTYDWRWHEPKKDAYTVTLSAENMRFIGNAIEAYTRVMNEIYIEPYIKEIVEKMNDSQ